MVKALVENPVLTTEIPAVKFQLFPKLPAETRIQIWSYFHLGPRLVVTMSGSSPIESANSKHEKRMRQEGTLEDAAGLSEAYSLNYDLPVLHHVCQETREEALRTFTLLLTTSAKGSKTWVDPKHDSIYLHDSEDYPIENLFGTHHLILDIKARVDFKKNLRHSSVWKKLQLFEQLQTITFVVHGKSQQCTKATDQISRSEWQDVVLSGQGDEEAVGSLRQLLGSSESKCMGNMLAEGQPHLQKTLEPREFSKMPRLRLVIRVMRKRQCCRFARGPQLLAYNPAGFMRCGFGAQRRAGLR